MGVPTWQTLMRDAVFAMLQESHVEYAFKNTHLVETPDRVVRMFEECFTGPDITMAKEVLKGFDQTTFPYGLESEMIHVNGIHFVSFCAHHLVPFICTGHFAYIPTKKVVGLSKIVRLVEIVAKRPQVQETLTNQVVEIFQEVIEPQGCAFVVDAKHMCMIARGVRNPSSWTRTSALRGEMFKTGARQEFFSSVPAYKGEL